MLINLNDNPSNTYTAVLYFLTKHLEQNAIPTILIFFIRVEF